MLPHNLPHIILFVATILIVFGGMSRAGPAVRHYKQLKCGECIYYGYNSCIRGEDHQIFAEEHEYNPFDNEFQSICYP